MSAASGDRAIDVMRREIATIPDVIDAQARQLRPAVSELVGGLEIDPHRPPELLLTGCGDSHYAGLGSRLAFERYAGVRCRAVEALELARYEIRYVPLDPPPVLVAVSYSGEVGRTIEAVEAARERGWRTLALTGRSDGRLARAAARSVLMDVPTLGFSPGTSTYVAMLSALYVLVAELAVAMDRPEPASSIGAALAAAPSLAARTLAMPDEPARVLAGRWASAPVATFLGAGPSKASAAFGAAKLFEGPQRYGVAQDLEEWAHEQYFVSGPETPITVVCPAGPGAPRARELLDEMAFIGSRPVLVTDMPGSTTNLPAAVETVPFASGLPEPLTPILSCLPLALAAFFLADRLGASSYGFPSAEREREHYETIHRLSRAEPA